MSPVLQYTPQTAGKQVNPDSLMRTCVEGLYRFGIMKIPSQVSPQLSSPSSLKVNKYHRRAEMGYFV